jgi:hypothetical protein
MGAKALRIADRCVNPMALRGAPPKRNKGGSGPVRVV